jgi:hypothetical protein
LQPEYIALCSIARRAWAVLAPREVSGAGSPADQALSAAASSVLGGTSTKAGEGASFERRTEASGRL